MTPTETTEQNPSAAPQTDAAAHDHAHDHDHTGHGHHHHAPALNPELTRTIEVTATTEEVDKSFARVVKQFRQAARIPGFRPGKVPETMIKSRFNREIRQQVLESLVSDRFRQAMETEKLTPASQPQISELLLNEGVPLKFKATFEAMPEINVDGYETVKAETPDATVSAEEFDAELDNVLEHHATVEPVEEDRPLADGDWAEIGFSGKVQALAQTVGEDGLESQEERPISGEDVLIQVAGKNTLQAFTEALRGAKVGQELQFEATYPADFGDASLAGKTVSYDVTVKAIKSKTFPEKDDEFAKTLGRYETFAEFESNLRQRVEDRKRRALESQARDKMLDELVARYNFPVPESFVQQQIDARLERGLRALAAQGMTADAMRALDFTRLREANRDQAINEVKASLILDKIAEREDITVSDEEMERELLMASIQAREPLDSLRKRLAEDGSLTRIREQLRREKTGQALYEKNRI